MLQRPGEILDLDGMSVDEFMRRALNTPLGAQIVAEREREKAGDRKQAAEMLTVAVAEADRSLARLDAEIAAAKKDIDRLSKELIEAQEQRIRLDRERHVVDDNRHRAKKSARARLRATAPIELLKLEKLVNHALHACRFQLNRRPGVFMVADIPAATDPAAIERERRSRDATMRAERTKFLALQKRAISVAAQVEAMMYCAAEPEPHEVARLRAELAAPDDLVKVVEGP
jgi:chromosome segregation ATPase